MSPVAVAQRAVACKWWRRLPGMRFVSVDAPGEAVRGVDADECPSNGLAAFQWIPGPTSLPDLDDPATRGCLLALVREAWGDPGIHTERTCAGADYWVVRRSTPARWDDPDGGDLTGEQDGEATALVVALEAAP